MPCINLDLEYFSHRKVLRLCARLGPWAEIIPLKLCAYTGKFHPETGHLIGYSADELITMIGVRPDLGRDASSILQALLDCGFLVTAEGGYQVHQWLEYQGHIAAFSIRGKTAAKARWSKLAEKDLYDATSMPDAMLKPDSSNAPTNYLTNYLTDLPPNLHTKPTNKECPEISGPVTSSKVKPQKKQFDDDSLPMESARFFWEYLQEWAPGSREPSKQEYQSWAKHFDLMLRVDKRTPADINDLLDWINRKKESPNGFAWKKVIQSPASLRAKWNERKFVDFLPSSLKKDEFK